MHTARELTDDLRALGVSPGMTVMVHASMRRVGPVEGGAAGLVEALERAVGPEGTLLMMISARDDASWIQSRPEAEREALLWRHAEPFASPRTPADPDNGVLAEVFRTLHGTVDDGHPEGRFAARGALARALTDAPPWHDYYGPGSALERLTRGGGRVLRLGADRETVTLIHYAEYLAALPSKRRVLRHRLVAQPDGAAAVRAVSCLDDCDGVVERDADYFGEILDAYLATGRARVGRVGGATSELLDAADLTAFAVAWMESHLVDA